NSNFMEKQPLRKINFEPFFYVAGIISLGNIAKSSGLANVIAVHLINIVSLETASAFNVLTFFVVLCIILGFIVTLPGVPAVVTPLIDNISGVSNVSKTFLCHIEVIGFSSVFFPFQAPPLMVVLQNENLSKARMTIYCSIVSAIGLLLLLPLALYWKML
ncbi:TPA: carboxylate transporter, partial [Streptococcus equi subsp. equi]|nr:carboxylate transporter [Streptococcus equi subsp. equi]